MALTDEDFMTIKELGGKWPYDWVSTRGLAPYVKRLGDKVVGIEIGTCRAESTAYLLEKCPNIDKIYTVDPYKAYDDWNGEITQETVDKFMKVAKANLKPYGKRFEMVREQSVNAADKFDNDSFDFIFVDGDHSYDATLADCIRYYPKLKKGGLFCGHDYSSIEAVYRAVTDFREKNKISSPINLSTNSTFFWYK
jgi:predicted O-methyltransferase YrrM